MRVCGVIVEYNPMHNGHVYHLKRSREVTGADAVVAVMSGNFLQRGEPAIVDKWTRTKMALANGADLVLELPVLYTIQSAELFAHGSVATLDALGIVNCVCFGSESGDLGSLKETAEKLLQERDQMSRSVRERLTLGYTYPRAVASVYQEGLGQSGSPLSSPNNVLGIEYLKALMRLQSSIVPYTIRRISSGHNDPILPQGTVASATAIRKGIALQGLDGVDAYVPDENLRLLEEKARYGQFPVSWESFYKEIRSMIVNHGPSRLALYQHFDAAVASRVYDAALTAGTVHQILQRSKSKNCTWVRLQRALTALLLELRKEDVQAADLDKGPTYIRVLGFTNQGRGLLAQARGEARVPIFTRVKKARPKMMEWDMTAALVYANVGTGTEVPEFSRTAIQFQPSNSSHPFE